MHSDATCTAKKEQLWLTEDQSGTKTDYAKYWLCLACLALLFLLESPLEIRCPKWLADEGGPDEAAFCGMAMRASMRSAGATAVAANSFWGG